MKFKAGLLVGYNGEGYCGLQLNKDLNTIEKAIGECLTLVEAVSESNSKDYSKIHICSSSRTDKGVHAVVNLVVCKIQKEIDQDLQQKLSSLLQEKGIHLYKIIRLTKSFIPSKQTAYRTYEYVVPTYFLQKGDIEVEIQQIKKEYAASNEFVEEKEEEKEEEEKIEEEKIEEEKELEKTTPPNKKRLKERNYTEIDIKNIFGYRATPEDLEVFKNIVLEYQGTHFYHNYTILSNPKGKQRYIQKVDVSETYVINNVEYIRITLEGQSFLLHQIRKMTYFALLLTKYRRDDYSSIFKESFTPARVHIPKGPSQYLLLDRPHFMDVKDKGKMIENLNVDETERLTFKDSISKLIHREENLYRFLACLDSTRWYNEEMPYLKNK